MIDTSFEGVNRIFLLLFENAKDRTVHTRYYLPKAEIKGYNMIDGKNVFEQHIIGYIKSHENIRKIAIGQGDDYTTKLLLDYPYFKENYKMTEIDLSK